MKPAREPRWLRFLLGPGPRTVHVVNKKVFGNNPKRIPANLIDGRYIRSAKKKSCRAEKSPKNSGRHPLLASLTFPACGLLSVYDSVSSAYTIPRCRHVPGSSAGESGQ
ncbi:uncharacterized protein UBRO_20602 [Ustilago bromivora]|uniref:Uncharacterized protein n=1 Tax=Ustilago bromivora TaxID=307758 RepID=A0A1K0G259_9BASI|nr:uncharacterized protein UBRO_20602 [Ustilago bromivora]